MLIFSFLRVLVLWSPIMSNSSNNMRPIAGMANFICFVLILWNWYDMASHDHSAFRVTSPWIDFACMPQSMVLQWVNCTSSVCSVVGKPKHFSLVEIKATHSHTYMVPKWTGHCEKTVLFSLHSWRYEDQAPRREEDGRPYCLVLTRFVLPELFAVFSHFWTFLDHSSWGSTV